MYSCFILRHCAHRIILGGQGDEMNKKKIKIILIVILAVILAVLIAIGIRFRNTVGIVFDWDNIVSFVNSVRYNNNDLETKLKDNQTKMEKLAQESPHINIRGDLTEEEKMALNEGKITKDEAVEIIKGDSTLEEILVTKENTVETGTDTPKEPIKEETPPQEEPVPGTENAPEDRVSEIVAELYVIQADFLSRLEGVGDSAYADYKAANYDRSQVASIVDSYMGTVTAMEAECDNTIKALLDELSLELQKVGGDQNLVKEIRNFYYNEKSLKKSYYLNKMYQEDYK